MTLDAFTLHAPALVAGVGIALVSAIAASKWLGPLGFIDHPLGRKNHETPTPVTGGIALLVTLALGTALGFRRLDLHPEQWAGLFALAAVGIADDRFGMRARHKAMAGLLIACLMAVPGAFRVVQAHPHLTLLGFIPLPPVWPLAFFLLSLLYWFAPQAVNLIDGANGLALGYGLVVLGVLALGGRPLAFCAGALLGLLALNWPRARHFLGDTGSLVLGLLLAFEVKRGVALISPDLILWIFAYPIMDVIMVVTIRLLAGRSLGEGDRSHLHHQWMDRFPRWRHWVVPGLWAQAALCASAPLVRGWGWLLPIAGLSLLLGQVLVFVTQSLLAERRSGSGVVEFQPVRADENDPDTSPGGGFDAA